VQLSVHCVPQARQAASTEPHQRVAVKLVLQARIRCLKDGRTVRIVMQADGAELKVQLSVHFVPQARQAASTEPHQRVAVELVLQARIRIRQERRTV